MSARTASSNPASSIVNPFDDSQNPFTDEARSHLTSKAGTAMLRPGSVQGSFQTQGDTATSKGPNSLLSTDAEVKTLNSDMDQYMHSGGWLLSEKIKFRLDVEKWREGSEKWARTKPANTFRSDDVMHLMANLIPILQGYLLEVSKIRQIPVALFAAYPSMLEDDDAFDLLLDQLIECLANEPIDNVAVAEKDQIEGRCWPAYYDAMERDNMDAQSEYVMASRVYPIQESRRHRFARKLHLTGYE